MANNQERRFFSKGGLRANKFTSGGQMRVDGMIPYGSITKINTSRGAFHETLSRAFRSTIAKGTDVRVLYNHNADMGVLGRVKSGTVKLQEDARGLAFTLDLPQSPLGQTIYESTARGDLDGVSFGFTVPDGGDSWDDDWTCDGSDGCEKDSKSPLRTITDLNLQEISLCVWPAYPTTSVKKSVVEDLSADPEDDDELEENGIIVSAEVRSRIIAARPRRLVTDAQRAAQIKALEELIRQDRAALARDAATVKAVSDLGLLSDEAQDIALDAAHDALKRTAARLYRLENASRSYKTCQQFLDDLPRLY